MHIIFGSTVLYYIYLVGKSFRPYLKQKQTHTYSPVVKYLDVHGLVKQESVVHQRVLSFINFKGTLDIMIPEGNYLYPEFIPSKLFHKC